MDNIYYKLIQLKLGKNISFKGNKIIVNLDSISDEMIINNDKQFKKAVNSDKYFYLSGGGSFILNKRYLMLVLRDDKTLINANKLSLFTGRSSGFEEWANPILIIRELFEEITIYKDHSLLLYKNKKYQSIIDQSLNQKSIHNNFIMNIDEYNVSNSILEIIKNNKNIWKNKVLMHISEKNDLNLLYFFNINSNLEKLNFFSHEDNINNKRQVYFYDLQNKEILSLNKANNFIPVIKSYSFTEHCKFAIDFLANNIIKEK